MDQVFSDPYLFRHILLYADYEIVIHYIYDDELFWRQKSKHDFNRDVSSAENYLELLSINGGVARGSERYIFTSVLAKRALKQGRRDLFDYMRYNKSRHYKWDWDSIIRGAIKNRQLFDYVKSLVGSNYMWEWQSLAERAIQKGQIELFEYIIRLAPSVKVFHLSHLAAAAATIGNCDLISYILTIRRCSVEWNFIAKAAIINGYKHVFDHIRKIALPYQGWRWQYLAKQAVIGGHRTLFDYIRTLANINWNWQKLGEAAVVSSSRDMFDYIGSLAPFNYSWNWYQLAAKAVAGGLELFEYIIALAPPLNLQKLAEIAVKFRPVFDYILSINYNWNWNELLKSAITADNRQLSKCIKKLTNLSWGRLDDQPIFEYIVSLNPTYNWDWQLLANTAVKFRRRSFDYILSLAPVNYDFNWKELIALTIEEHNRDMFNHIRPMVKLNHSELSTIAIRELEILIRLGLISRQSQQGKNPLNYVLSLDFTHR